MADSALTIGIIGGSGMLGRAIGAALLERGGIAPDRLWIANRSGRLQGEGPLGRARVTARNQQLADACDVILLSVPPDKAAQLGISAPGKLVVSVMAGISLDQIAQITGARRAVRAMSSPAAALGVAFSPWVASPAVTDGDRAALSKIFGACGATAEVSSEAMVETFTALTGPVPGFVAYFAECMASFATRQGIPEDVADLAIRQLFLAAGQMMATGDATPADHVQEMVDYAGTTAAGLTAMRASALERCVAEGLQAAVDKTRAMG
ncbi:MAG: NAD(P)-binding domain-containing protein [Alphaproteobacteria bacterium]|nr:NAD(P)-binding domain-containing protein [Alphaproteobacteria bacterium]NNF25394.1 NAD(P)-binding domain-containing protein [Paracoccaceae bacterium]